MTIAARQKAARCFALAASTTFAAERETAIERGKAICAAASLDLDDFDIPGRTPTKPRARPFPDMSGRGESGSWTWSPYSATAEDIMADIAAMMRGERPFPQSSRAKPKPASRYFRNVSEAAEYIRKSPATVYSAGDGLGGITWTVRTEKGERSGIDEDALFRLAEALMTPAEKAAADLREKLKRQRDDDFAAAFYGRGRS